MDQYLLKWPVDFDDYRWELESKGWFVGLEILVNGNEIKPMFYEPERLAQDIAQEMSVCGFFAEPCLIVVSRVTRELIEAAVEKLASTGDLGRFGAH